MMKMEYFEAHCYSWNFPIIFRSPGWCNSTVVEIFLQVFQYVSIKSNQNRTEQAGTYDLLQCNQVPLLYHCAIFSYIKEKKGKSKRKLRSCESLFIYRKNLSHYASCWSGYREKVIIYHLFLYIYVVGNLFS